MSEWYGVLPERWDCKKIGSLFSERRIKVSDKEYLPLSVAKIGVVPQLASAVKTDAGDNRKLVKAGDFAINSRSDRKGSCGISELDGSVSLINIVLTPRDEWSRKYVHYLLRSQPFSEEYYRHGRGIVADLWTTRFSEMKSILLPIPPRPEQDQIVRFLDWKVSKINRLIEVKKREIGMLSEYLQAEIEEQIALYPVVNNVRLKQLGKFFKGGGFSRENLTDKNNCPAILYGDIYTQYEYKTNNISHFIDIDAYGVSRKIQSGDIVMAGTGETKDEIGKPILYYGSETVAVGGDVIVFSPNKNINSEYILFQLYSKASLKHRYIHGKGDIIVHIYPSTLGNTLIPLIADGNQEQMVASVNQAIQDTKKTQAIMIEELKELEKLKTTLISDVVTGQIDVRNIEIPDFEYIEDASETTGFDEDIEVVEE